MIKQREKPAEVYNISTGEDHAVFIRLLGKITNIQNIENNKRKQHSQVWLLRKDKDYIMIIIRHIRHSLRLDLFYLFIYSFVKIEM